jgi:hypothetical protein
VAHPAAEATPAYQKRQNEISTLSKRPHTSGNHLLKISHHIFEVLVHWEEPAAQVLRRLQVLQYANKKPCTALLLIFGATTVLLRRAAVEDNDLVDTEYGCRAGYLTGQLK